MSIMTQLEFELDFSHSEKQIARYILDNGEDVLSMSVKELANKTYTSPATIVRLCRKIGLEGYNDFKIKYSAELQYDKRNQKRIDVNFPFLPHDSKETIAENLVSLTNEVIHDTHQLIDFEELNKITDLLYNSEEIDIYGFGNSILAGLSFQHKMARIAKMVNIRTIPGEQIFLTSTSNEKKAAIVISYSGETNEIIRFVKVLKTKKTPIIAITSLGDNQLSDFADYTLHLDSREKIFSKMAPFASQISMEYILNIIFSCIYQKDYEENTRKKIDFDKVNDSRRPSQSPVSEDI
ncbi:MAG: MurR/RpiR family transcriptional regulator [Bacilli bacterium]|nr:MurR/RpiR family transcriptional regulator [Bacilli bacterium]